MWEQYNRVIKDNGAIVLFGTEPFTSRLICSNIALFKYTWTWKKSKCGGFLNAKNAPLRTIETIIVFSNGSSANKCKNRMCYNPQGLIKCNKRIEEKQRNDSDKDAHNFGRKSRLGIHYQNFKNYPKDFLDYPSTTDGLHPTQKPVALLEYLIKTYTNEGETVLDNCMGSGSTGAACLNTKRNFIGIEKDDKYFDVAKERLK